jgi:hypothetical protein
MQELQILSPRILNRLRELLGSTLVKELKFEIGPLPPPAVGVREEPPTELKKNQSASRPYPENIEKALDAIDDPQLKATIEETLRKALDV